MAISHNYGITDFPIPTPRGATNGDVIQVLNDQYVLGTGGGGVGSLNGLTGAVSLTSTGATITITPSGSTINLEAVGGGSSSVNIPYYSYFGGF